jgi:hypothetical protein
MRDRAFVAARQLGGHVQPGRHASDPGLRRFRSGVTWPETGLVNPVPDRPTPRSQHMTTFAIHVDTAREHPELVTALTVAGAAMELYNDLDYASSPEFRALLHDDSILAELD